MSSPDLGLDGLAARVRSEGLVRAQVGDTRLVCLTEDAFERLTAHAAHAAAPPDQENPSPTVHLTPREVQALRLVAGGMTAAETAAVLGVAVNTVSQHLVGARRKYGVSSTRAAVERARRDGAL